jgi:predicted alpha/beta-fold hydrolase
MTLVPPYWPRRLRPWEIPPEARLFVVAPESQIMGCCHWQPRRERQATVILVHGLEGSSDSHYMVGIARKAYSAGFNVVRLNQRNCGGTEHLTPTLYNGGLSADLRAVATALSAADGIEAIWFVGYSLGGNLVLKMAGEVGSTLTALKGVVAVSPSIDPALCVEALERPSNWIYHRSFVAHLRARIRRKARLFPGRFDPSPLAAVRTLRQLDEAYTAPDGGYASAADYYERSGARDVLGTITVPTLIITAQDDPCVPYRQFETPILHGNPWIRLAAPRHGGHCGFLQRPRPAEDVFWAENRLVDFIAAD